MATGQDLLNLCEVLDNELHLQSAESDVARGLIALNAAQDTFEAVVAGHPNLMGDTTGTLTITNDTETTAFPTGLLRLDKIWMLQDSKPIYPIQRIDATGGHPSYRGWPFYAAVAPGGRVRGYWSDGRNIYWAPRPGQGDTARWYGFQAAAAITAAGTFAYPDIVLLPIAALATKLLRAGVGDDSVDLNEAAATFGPVVRQLATFNRDRASRLLYQHMHVT